MKSYEHLSYDPVAWADELARLDVTIAEKIENFKQQEEENEKEVFAVAADIFK